MTDTSLGMRLGLVVTTSDLLLTSAEQAPRWVVTMLPRERFQIPTRTSLLHLRAPIVNSTYGVTASPWTMVLSSATMTPPMPAHLR